MAVNPISVRYPFELRDQPQEVVQAHRYSFQGLVDLNQAIASLKSQIDTLSTSTSTASTSSSTNTVTVTDVLAALGTINDQTGQTAYTTQTQDAGALLVLNDASPVAVTLNSVVATPFALFIANFGLGTVTLTPSSGTVNGGASLAVLKGQTIWAVFGGTNWHTGAFTTPPQNTPAILHEFITAFNAATGVFTQAQPAFTDVSGVATTAQIGTGSPAAGKYVDGAAGAWTTLPVSAVTKAPVAGEYLTGYDSTTGAFSQSTPAGISAVIVTAALTGLGTQGSMTFSNGILTAQTPAT